MAVHGNRFPAIFVRLGALQLGASALVQGVNNPGRCVALRTEVAGERLSFRELGALKYEGAKD